MGGVGRDIGVIGGVNWRNSAKSYGFTEGTRLVGRKKPGFRRWQWSNGGR